MKKALIVVDVQKDFIDGALANPAAEAAMPTIHEVVDFAAKNNFDIFYTQDTHYAEFYMDSQEGKNLPVPHCIFQTPGWAIDKRAWASNPMGSVQILIKSTFGYEDWNWEDLNLYNEIVVIGFCTDICVITNALLIKTVVPETPIVVIENACAGVTPEKHAVALEVMRSCQINTVKWEDYK